CQPKNHDSYHEQNSCYDSNSIGFDQSQPQQYTVNHPIFSAHHDLLGSQKRLNITLTKVTEQMTQLTTMCEMACQIVQKNLEEKQLEEEQAVKAQNWKLPVCYDDDDDEEITPTEPIDSLSLGDEHLDTIPATESDEFIKSCVEHLVPNPSESVGENGCDVLACFTTFSNVLFDVDYDFYSSDDQSLSDEDVPEKIYSNPLIDEEIIPMEIDQHSFNAESDLIESMPNHDSSITISSKIDSLFNEFTSELTLLTSIPPGIDETDCHPEKEIHFPRDCCTKTHLFDSDSHMEEIDLPFTPDDPMPLGIEEDDYDSGRDVPILEELLDNYSLALPANESYHFDIPSPYRPPAKPPDGKTGTLNIKMLGDVSDQKCQPKNHDYYHEQNSCYDSNSIGFDQSQPQQYTVNHPIFSAHHDLLGSQKWLNITLTKVTEKMTQLTSMCEMACQIVQKNLEDKQLEEEQAVKAQNWKLPVCYDDDDDEESSNSLNDNTISELPPCVAVTPTEPIDSLSLGDEHLDTILATESDEFIKSCVENLVPNPSESVGENGCDVLACFTTFSNVLFDVDYDFYSSDDQSLSDEDVPEKIYSNPLFDEEIIPMEIDQHSFNAESDLIESMPNHDSLITISSKIDSLFDEFTSELTLLTSIPPGIDETDCHPEKEIRFSKRFLYDNSSLRLPEEIVFENSHADIESFSSSPIHNKDSNSHMEEIDLPFTPDDPMPSGIEEDDYDSGRDVPILEELLDNYSLALSANESYHFDIPLPYRPPAKPPDGKTGTLNIKILGDVSDQKVPIPNLMITRVSNQEKSPDLLSHLGFEAFQPSTECPMIINGKNIPLLDVPLFHFYPP
nr:hypothetical protein [Tanacetum cinerariifolium]